MDTKTLQSPTIPSVDANGYEYVENAPWWKDACAKLPCFAALRWPDYDTKVIEETVDGQPIVIQLWKGWCQKFLGLDNFPGGVGAEIGIYRRPQGDEAIEIPQRLPKALRHLLQSGMEAAEHDLWWPYPELQTSLTFDFVNPKNGEKVFSAGPEKTYWLCKWMDEESYLKYRLAHFGKTPMWGAQYRLDFTVNGKPYSW
jgi:hypothetical protein